MKKPPDIESPQPTSETQPQATALEGPTWSRGIRGGFVVNPGTLTAIERILSSFVAEGGAEVPDTKEVIVLYYGHPPDTIDSVSSVATLRNPRAFSIAALMAMPCQWVDRIGQRRSLDKLILDLDSSMRQTYGRRERSVRCRRFAL